jgi:hypothetical protein
LTNGLQILMGLDVLYNFAVLRVYQIVHRYGATERRN